jgi:hypothetical protein
VSIAGTRLIYNNVHRTFHQLTLRAGLRPRSPACRPRIHDLRHTFAVTAQVSGVASDATFGRLSERLLPGAQRRGCIAGARRW